MTNINNKYLQGILTGAMLGVVVLALILQRLGIVLGGALPLIIGIVFDYKFLARN